MTNQELEQTYGYSLGSNPSNYASASPRDLTIDLRGPMDEEVIDRLAQRNEERLKAAQQALGHRWVLWATRQAA